jgi:Ca2+-binding RTX toxin-like protein
MGGRHTALRALGATAGILLTATTGAHAASVSTTLGCVKADCSGSFSTFRADPGEANRLSISSVPGAVGALYSEASLPIRAGTACKPRSATTAFCEVGFPRDVLLGDGDDQASTKVGGTLVGGPGNDRLDGGSPMNGGPGSDSLTGTSRPDLFIDGDTGEPDAYNGGAGNDAISYEGRRARVRLTIGKGGTGDVLNSIESATGGSGNDTLTGDAGPNTLDGGPGRDTLDGGPGNDTLALSKGDRVRCGPGSDRVAIPRSDLQRARVVGINVPADCEAADFRGAFLSTPPRRKGRSVYVRVRATTTGSIVGDSRLRLLVGGRVVGQTRAVTRRGTYRIKLGRAGRRLARRGKLVTLQERGVTKADRKDIPGDSLRYRLR